MIRIVAILTILAALSACARPEPMERVVEVPRPIRPPTSLMRCMPAPDKPAGEYTQADVGDFLLELAEAGEDCRGKLDAVRRYVEKNAG